MRPLPSWPASGQGVPIQLRSQLSTCDCCLVPSIILQFLLTQIESLYSPGSGHVKPRLHGLQHGKVHPEDCWIHGCTLASRSPLYLGHEVVTVVLRPGVLQEVEHLEVDGRARRGELGLEAVLGLEAPLKKPERGGSCTYPGRQQCYRAISLFFLVFRLY